MPLSQIEKYKYDQQKRYDTNGKVFYIVILLLVLGKKSKITILFVL